MTAAAPQIDLAIAATRRQVEAATTPRERLRALWSGARHARRAAEPHIVYANFVALGDQFGRLLGSHAAEDLRHVVNWATHDLDPWGRS